MARSSVYFRIFLYLFVVFGLLIALPVMVWDLLADRSGVLIAAIACIIAVFVPFGVITWFNIEDDPTDEDVPFRFREDAAVRASIVAGLLLGGVFLLWLVG